MLRLSGNRLQLARECAASFFAITGVGCVLYDANYRICFEAGYGCASCGLCACAGREQPCEAMDVRVQSSAARFGGKYIYACPLGLTCVTSPVETDYETCGGITAGPFLLAEREDYIQCELSELALAPAQHAKALSILQRIPQVPPRMADALTKQLFWAVSGLGNSLGATLLLQEQHAQSVLDDVAEQIHSLKAGAPSPEYPLALENELLQAVSVADRAAANARLNELLGHVFFSAGGQFSSIRARVCELLVSLSRAAIRGGAESAQVLSLSEQNIQQLQTIYDTNRLCVWLSSALQTYMACMFDEESLDSRDVMPRALAYIRRHCGGRLTLRDTAESVYLSPSYFSHFFKKEMGQSFSQYLTAVRLERARMLLRQSELSLAEVAARTGFVDQSHFNKVFKAELGVTPGVYRKRRGRGYDELAEP